MNSRKEQFNRRAFLKFGSLAIGAGLVSRYLSSPTLASIVTAENLQRDYPVPGLVLYLHHSLNTQIKPSPISHPELIKLEGGDEGADGEGFVWWMVKDFLGPSYLPTLILPRGIVLGLKHFPHQAADRRITVFGWDPVRYPDQLPRLERRQGGDLGARAGHGFCWYESTGEGCFTEDEVAKTLPPGTVLGLKHSMNQPTKTVVWQGRFYDPAREGPAPPGFERKHGGDYGAPAGQGYFWYERCGGKGCGGE